MPQTFSDVACTVCGCVCDDLRVTVSGDRISHVEGACRLAEPWFASLSEPSARPPASIDGQPAPLAQAVERAAEILRAQPCAAHLGSLAQQHRRATGRRAAGRTDRRHDRHDRLRVPRSFDHGDSRSGRVHLFAGRSPQSGRPGHLLGRRPGHEPPTTFRAVQRRCDGAVHPARSGRSPRDRDRLRSHGNQPAGRHVRQNPARRGLRSDLGAAAIAPRNRAATIVRRRSSTSASCSGLPTR